MNRATRGFPKAFRKAVFAAAAVWACAAGARAAVEDPALDKLLLRAAEYCRRIEASVLDFICREEVKETIHPIPAPSLSSSGEITGFRLSNRMPVWLRDKKTYVYDYQCTRSGAHTLPFADSQRRKARAKKMAGTGICPSEGSL